MLKQLFPIRHVIGFVSSIILSLVALAVLFLDLSTGAVLALLLTTAILQASVQLFLFMHIGESSDKKSVYVNIIYAIFIGVVVVTGTLFTMIWGYQ